MDFIYLLPLLSPLFFFPLLKSFLSGASEMAQPVKVPITKPDALIHMVGGEN